MFFDAAKAKHAGERNGNWQGDDFMSEDRATTSVTT